MKRVYAEIVFVFLENGIGDCQCIFESALGEEKVGFREEEIWIRGKVVVGRECFGCGGESGGILVLG